MSRKSIRDLSAIDFRAWIEQNTFQGGLVTWRRKSVKQSKAMSLKTSHKVVAAASFPSAAAIDIGVRMGVDGQIRRYRVGCALKGKHRRGRGGGWVRS